MRWKLPYEEDYSKPGGISKVKGIVNMRTDLQIAQLASIPNVGNLLGKNTIYTDSIFNTKVVRLTDGATSNNDSMQTNAAGSYGNWNTDDTLTAFQNTSGGTYFFQFDPVKMQGTQLPIKIAGNGCFSKVNNNVYYCLIDNHHTFQTVTGNGTAAYKITFQMINGVWTYESVQLMFDFGDMLPVNFQLSWVSEFECSQQDLVFSAAFSAGNQDTGFLACLYKVGSGFRLFNTQTLQITGQWGKTGKATLQNTKYKNFFIHGIDQTPNPSFTIISAVGNTTGGFIWNNSGLTMKQPGLSGHHGTGYLSAYMNNVSGGNFVSAAYSNPQTHVKVIPEQKGPPGMPDKQVPVQLMIGDEHCAFGPINQLDESLLWVTYDIPVTYPKPFTSCWMGEVTGVDVTGKISGKKGSVYRLCHTYNSGQSTEYEIQASMVAPSQTGKFIAFCSDLVGNGTIGTLGSTAGDDIGTVVPWNSRGDVFIAQVTQVGV